MDAITGAGAKPIKPISKSAKTSSLAPSTVSKPDNAKPSGTGPLAGSGGASKMTLEGQGAHAVAGAADTSLPLDSAARKKEFNRLLPDEQKALEKLYETLVADKGPKAGKHLMALLDGKKLTSIDSTGKSLIEQLEARMNDKPAKGLGKADANDLLYDVIKGIARPDKIFQGDGSFTCAPASVQGILASENPAEYARLALGLTFDGKAKTKSGKTIELDTSEVGKKDGARGTLDEAVQGSFKAHAEKYTEGGAADFGAGRVGGASRFGGGRLGSALRFGAGRLGGAARFGGGGVAGVRAFGQFAKGNDGLTKAQIGHLYEDVIGRKTVQVPVNAYNKGVVYSALQEVLAKDLKVPVGVTGKDKDGNATNHVVTLEALKPGVPPQAVVQDSGSGTKTTMPLGEFLNSMQMAIVPTQDIRLLRALQGATYQAERMGGDGGGDYAPNQSYGGAGYNEWLPPGQNSDGAFYTYNSNESSR